MVHLSTTAPPPLPLPPSSSPPPTLPPPRRRLIQLFPPNVPPILPASVLILQTATPLLIRFSRRLKEEGEPSYSPAILTLVAEIFKWFLALILMTRTRSKVVSRSRASFGPQAIMDCLRGFSKALTELRSLLIPALLYFIGNVISIHALSLVRSYIFTAIMNSRIVFAALLSVVLLKKAISPDQFRAIIIIFCAATMLCLEDVQVNEDQSWGKETFGILMSLTAAGVSATGGVFMEKYLNPRKSALSRPSSPLEASLLLWEQQGVLACYSALMALTSLGLFDRPSLAPSTVFAGWTPLTWLIMGFQAIQGMLVAATIQHCGIVFRLIIGTLSICMCIIFEAVVFSEPILARELLTIALVILGSNLYATSSSSSSNSSSSSSSSRGGDVSSAPVAMLLDKPCTDCHSSHRTSSSSSCTTCQRKSSIDVIKEGREPPPTRQLSMQVKVTILLILGLATLSSYSSITMMIASSSGGKNSPITSEFVMLPSNYYPDGDNHNNLPGGSSGGFPMPMISQHPGFTPASPGQQVPSTSSQDPGQISHYQPALRGHRHAADKDAVLNLGCDRGDSSLPKLEEEPWVRHGRGGRRDLALCVWVPDDTAAHLVDEFMAFHWIQGAGHFLVYLDASSTATLRALGKYLSLGVADYYKRSGGEGAQMADYHHCLSKVQEEEESRHRLERGQQGDDASPSSSSSSSSSPSQWVGFLEIGDVVFPPAEDPHARLTTLSEALHQPPLLDSTCLQIPKTGSSPPHSSPVLLLNLYPPEPPLDPTALFNTAAGATPCTNLAQTQPPLLVAQAYQHNNNTTHLPQEASSDHQDHNLSAANRYLCRTQAAMRQLGTLLEEAQGPKQGQMQEEPGQPSSARRRRRRRRSQ